MIDCTGLRDSLADSVGAAFRCLHEDNQTLRVVTPFAFPNGDLVDVFIVEQDDALVATDFGESLRYLSSINVSIEAGKRSAQFADFLRLSGVRNTRGNLVLDIKAGSEVESILRLCEAILRVADLGISSRQRSLSAEFKSLIRPELRRIAENLVIVEDPTFFGMSGEVYDLDFEIQRRFKSDGLVIVTLSAPDTSAADYRVDETVRIWDDLNNIVLPDRRVTVLDTRNPNVMWREQWLRQLKRHSSVLAYEELPEIRALLAA